MDAGPDSKRHPVYSQVPKQETPLALKNQKNRLSAALGGGGGGPITSRSVSERRAGSDDVSKTISFQQDDGENSDPNARGTKFEAMMPQNPSMLSINSTMLHQSVAGNDSIINLSVDSFRPSSTTSRGSVGSFIGRKSTDHLELENNELKRKIEVLEFELEAQQGQGQGGDKGAGGRGSAPRTPTNNSREAALAAAVEAAETPEASRQIVAEAENALSTLDEKEAETERSHSILRQTIERGDVSGEEVEQLVSSLIPDTSDGPIRLYNWDVLRTYVSQLQLQVSIPLLPAAAPHRMLVD
jgi:hypothetical protein